MRSLIFCLATLAAVLAAPQQAQDLRTTPIPILRSAQDTDFAGGYSFSFETGNEIQREEQSELRNAGTPDEIQEVRGSYSYRDPDGNPVFVTYTAGENGFIAESSIIPTAPPLPPAIAEALARNAEEEARLSDAQRAEIDTGRYVLQ